MARQYNACFAIYADACKTAAPLKYILVNYYSKYLISFINHGENVYPIIRESSIGHWSMCFRFMKDLWDYKHVDDEMRSQWYALSKIMVSIFKSDDL